MGIFDVLKKSVQTFNQVIKTEEPEQNKNQTFKFSSIPMDLSQLQAVPEINLDNPFKTAALTICSFYAWTKNKENGIQMINFLKGPEQLSPADIQFIDERLRKNYVPASYFCGAFPENDYEPSNPLQLTVFENPYSYQEDGYAKLFVQSNGADTERPITLRRKGNGQWFLWNYKSILTDIRIPKSMDAWS